jgi:hypothetical protein
MAGLLLGVSPAAPANSMDAAKTLQMAFGHVSVKSADAVSALLGRELQGRSVPQRPTGAVEMTAILERVDGRRLLLNHADYGFVAVFLSTTADVTGLLDPGVRVRVEGHVIEDFVQSANVDVMASAVTTIEGRAPSWVASR